MGGSLLLLGMVSGSFAAFRTARVEYFDVRLAESSDVEEKEVLGRLLLKAVARGDVSKVKRLLAQGAPVDARDDQGRTGLTIASNDCEANLGIVSALLKAGAKVMRVAPDYAAGVERQKQLGSCLLCAVENADLLVINHLLMLGAPVDGARSWRGQTALMRGIENGNASVVRALLQAGADIKVKDMHGKTMLKSAVIDCPRNASVLAEVVKAWVEADANIDELDEAGLTVLTHSVKNCSINSMKTLIHAGAHVNARNRDGWTVLMMASCAESNVAAVKILLAAGADVNVQSNSGLSALMRAVSSPSVLRSKKTSFSTIHMLVLAGADVNASNWLGETALSIAHTKGFEGMIHEALAERKAYVSRRDEVISVLQEGASVPFAVAYLVLGYESKELFAD